MLDRSASRGGGRIIVYGTPKEPFVNLVHNFYTTASANIITWNRAFALFPKRTFVEGKDYLLQHITKELADHFDLLERLKWEPSCRIIRGSRLDDDADQRPPFGQRRVGDCYTWTMQLPNHDEVSPPVNENDPRMEDSCFEMTRAYYPDNEDDAERTIGPSTHRQLVPGCHQFSSIVLRHKVATANLEMLYAFYCKFRILATMQLCRLPGDQRPEDCLRRVRDRGPRPATRYVVSDQFACQDVTDFEKPSDWKYYDHLIPEIYDEYIAHSNLQKKSEKEEAGKARFQAPPATTQNAVNIYPYGWSFWPSPLIQAPPAVTHS